MRAGRTRCKGVSTSCAGWMAVEFIPGSDGRSFARYEVRFYTAVHKRSIQCCINA